MIDDRNPDFARGFRVSSAQLGTLRRRWGDIGRKVYADAIRTGREVVARTEAEIEALGRAQLRRAELQQAQTKAAARAATGAVRNGAGIVQRGVAAVGQEILAAGGALAETDRLRQQQEQVVRKSGAGIANTAAHFLRPGTPEDPGPVRLFGEWATGLGPQRRVLGPESSFSREFAQAPSVQAYLQDYLADWRQRDGGVSGTYANPSDKRANFRAGQFLEDLSAGNGASHFVGSWGVEGQRRGDGIDWQTENDTDTTSFFYGRPLRERGLPFVPSYDRPWPGGRTHQAIQFRTDLDGRPLNMDR